MKHGSDYIPLRSSTWKLIFCAGLVIFVFAVASAQKPSASKFTVKPLALPGASGLVMLDYLAYDRTSRRLWVPAGNTGSVDVIDAATNEIKRVSGFPVTQVEFRGKLRPVGRRRWLSAMVCCTSGAGRIRKSARLTVVA